VVLQCRHIAHALPSRRRAPPSCCFSESAGPGARELYEHLLLVLKSLAPPSAFAVSSNGVASAAAVLLVPDDVLRTWLLATIAAQDALLALLYDGAHRGRRRSRGGLHDPCPCGAAGSFGLRRDRCAARHAARDLGPAARALVRALPQRGCCRRGRRASRDEGCARRGRGCGRGGRGRRGRGQAHAAARGEGPRSSMEVEASFRGAAWLCACAVTLSLLVALHRGEGRNADAASAWVPGHVLARSLSSLLQARALG
jgi:hypothetical protein